MGSNSSFEIHLFSKQHGYIKLIIIKIDSSLCSSFFFFFFFFFLSNVDQNPDGPYNVSGLLTNMYQLVLVMNLKPEKFFTRSIDKLADMGAYGTLT